MASSACNYWFLYCLNNKIYLYEMWTPKTKIENKEFVFIELKRGELLYIQQKKGLNSC